MTCKYTFFVHMNARKEWLRLSREERHSYFSHIKDTLLNCYPSVSLRLFDVEAFNAQCSDIAMYETYNIQDYYFLIEELRDSEIYTVPYFDIVGIFPALEDGFKEYEAIEKANH